MNTFDVIVVGGGHAGIEAAMASSRMGKKTALITDRIDTIGHTPCNPSIGGSAKGIVVREIAALGGVMPKIADSSLLQLKMLNKSKGPAVWSLRSQIDVEVYPKVAQQFLLDETRVTIIEKRVGSLLVEDNECIGVTLENEQPLKAKATILTTGTYMDSTILVGHTKDKKTATGEVASKTLSDDLRLYGFDLFRLKTGTPARIKRDSIDFSQMEIQTGDSEKLSFSIGPNAAVKVENELPCYLTYCAEDAIGIIKDNLQESAMYSGNVEGVGARYCPSIEDKIVRFSDKNQHQVFIEPESALHDSMYVQGMSTSMPPHIQDEMLHKIAGLENCEVIKYGYAIEYDAIVPTQLYPTLETKLISNLYTAGQINGTSGYEEAASQGLMAAINAVYKMDGKEPFVLSRDEAYIGVLIDDLVTKGTKEPYRLLTSRAEYRLLLRHDNADLRLMDYGYACGLISEDIMHWQREKRQAIETLKEQLETLKVTPKAEVLSYLQNHQLSSISDGIVATTFLKRPEITWDHLIALLKLMGTIDETTFAMYTPEVIEQVVIQIKYEGYINKAKQQVAAFLKLENKKIPADIQYEHVPNLAIEAKEKLSEVLPLTLGQASRIAGVNAVDITMLDMYLKKHADNRVINKSAIEISE